MNRTPPSIRQHLLRIHLLIAFMAVMLIFIYIIISDWRMTRRLQISNFQNSISAAAQGSATYLSLKDIRSLEIHLRDFQSLSGLMSLCVYNSENTLLYEWHAVDNEEECPRLILREGKEEQWLEVDSAIPLMKGKTFIGMLYANSRVIIWRDLLLRNSLALLVMLGVAYGACAASSRYGARAITDSLQALQDQIECLRNRDYANCALLPPMTTRETAGLAHSITEFRSHLSTTMLPRVQFKHARQWYCTLFSGWIAVLRQQLHADSPLLHQLSHYELLLHIELDNPLPPTEQIDLAALLKASVASARAVCAERPSVHLSATLQSSIQHLWRGYAELLHILLEHLLMIGLQRTEMGAVCLRLEVQDVEKGSPQLKIKFEDSGPPLQGWQLRQWLAPGKDDVPTSEMAQQTSWLLVGRLFHYMNGEVNAEITASGGLLLVGSVPLLMPSLEQQLPQEIVTIAAPSLPSAQPPLIMVVEPNAEKGAALEHLFLRGGCRIFLMEDHAQAIEWAPTLPLSAIVLNGFLPDAGAHVVRRLKHLTEEGLMLPMQLWAMGVTNSTGEQKQWLEAGISELISVPVQPKQLLRLYQQLAPAAQDFYHAYDKQVHAELPSKILTRLSELNLEIARQVDQLEAMLEAMANGQEQPLMAEQAHAVKSAALSLGYFRLAALMAQIEHALAHKQFLKTRMHWAIIADSLHHSSFKSL